MHTTMSPEAAKRRSIGTRSRSLSTVATLRCPVVRMASASDTWSTPSIGSSPAEYMRRDDDAVGILEAGGEIVEQVAHARVAMRLDHGDDAAARAGAGRFQHRGDLHGMMAVVVVDGDAVPGAGELEAALDAGEARHRLADRVVGDAGLARRGDRRQRIERIVMAGQRHGPAAQRARAAFHALAQVGVEHGLAAVDAGGLQHEVGGFVGAVGQQPAPVPPEPQALDHVADDGMIDAGHSQAVEGDVAEEGLELPVHVVDGLEVVEVLGIDVGDDADLGRDLDEGAVGFVGLHDHPRPFAAPRVGAPVVDDAAGDDGRVEAARVEQVGDQRRGGGLAVRARDGHRRVEAHQLGQHFGAADDRQALGARRFQLGVAASSRRWR